MILSEHTILSSEKNAILDAVQRLEKSACKKISDIKSQNFKRVEENICLQKPHSALSPLSLPSLFLNNDVLLFAIAIAIERGFVGVLNKGTVTIKQLAKHSDLPARSIIAILHVLGALNLIEHKNELFSLSQDGQDYLLTNSPYYIGDLFVAKSYTLPKYTLYEQAFINNKAMDKHISQWEKGVSYLPQAWAASMHQIMLGPAHFLTDHKIFSQINSLIDIGGGPGTIACLLATKYPAMRIATADLADMSKQAQQYIRKYQLSKFVKTITLDMFNDHWSIDYGTILFSNILHDWSVEKCKLLLKSAYDALSGGDQVLLHEQLLTGEGFSGPLITALFSVQMLCSMQGQQFSEVQITDLLTSIGFVHVRIEALPSQYSLVLATKPYKRK